MFIDNDDVNNNNTKITMFIFCFSLTIPVFDLLIVTYINDKKLN